LNTVVHQSLVLLAPRFREQRIEVENLLGNDLPSITADPDRLEQVFVNLLNNAADAMPEGGKVRVEIARMRAGRGSWLVVSIADTGSGIAEEHLKSIFDPFFTTKPTGKGTGLGLSVSYGIVRDHGGNIDVESRVGQGTIFRLRLPVDGMHHEEL
jgi:two-component system NtrC family sensor kinase